MYNELFTSVILKFDISYTFISRAYAPPPTDNKADSCRCVHKLFIAMPIHSVETIGNMPSEYIVSQMSLTNYALRHIKI